MKLIIKSLNKDERLLKTLLLENCHVILPNCNIIDNKRNGYPISSYHYKSYPDMIPYYAKMLFDITLTYDKREIESINSTHVAVEKFIGKNSNGDIIYINYSVYTAKIIDDNVPKRILYVSTFYSKDSLHYFLMRYMKPFDELTALAKERGLFNETYS
jgi:hypothetical protein